MKTTRNFDDFAVASPRTYYGPAPSVSDSTKLRAIGMFIQGAPNPVLLIDFIDYIDKSLKKIHCAVLRKDIADVKKILEKHHFDYDAFPKKAVIINENGGLRQIL